MRKLSTFVAAAVLIMVLVACKGDQLTKDPSSELRPTKERAAPTATNADVAALVRGNCAFTFDLALREDGKNLFYSPYSLQHLPCPRHDIRWSTG